MTPFPRSEGRPEGPPDPWDQDKLNELESDRIHSATRQGIGLTKGPMGFVRGAWARIGLSFKFKIPQKKG